LTVSHVYAGSPAAAAGIRRGDVVRAINGIPVDAFRAGAAPTVSRRVESTRFEFASSGHARGEVTIAWAEYSRPAVILDNVIDAGGRRVGYLVLQDFDELASLEFAQAAARLRKQGIDDLVLDLRMNPGGSVHVARAIASTIGGRRLDGATFLRIVHNDRYRDSDHDVPFRSSWQVDLSLPRLFVITSEDSCSASEALINGLAPHMTVVTVGTTTCGKPVGMTVVEYGAWSYWVITFRVLNARGEGDYFAGLRPTCPAEDDFAHELGDPAEASLGAALHYVRHGRCPDRSPASPRAR
jgi:C-terminal processing protease CtpA/Prc